MALVEKIVKIADAIRLKNGSSDKMTLEDMEKAIKNFNGETLLKPAEYPDYIRTEIMRVANEVRNVLTKDSFISICMSDSHYPSLGTATLHALMAIKGLTYLIPVDFIAHLGDLGLEGSGATNTDYLASNILEILSYMDEDGADSIPLFAAIGNHDCGNYITTNNKDDQLPAEWLYEHFTKLSESDNTVMAGEDVGGYCYRDFPSNKIRVFLLNTAEGLVVGGHSQDTATSATQRAWFASKLQELNSKSDASTWSFIVLCHYPADYGASRPLSNLLAAYVEGSSFTENGTTYNFNGNNAARFIAQFHGHIHNYLYEKLYKGSTPTQYDAWRVGVPNSGDADRTNHNKILSGINYAEETTQTKIPNTAEDTSFVVNVINLSENKLYSFNYGKGYNRTIGLDKIIYCGISKNLVNVTLSNEISSVEYGQPYYSTITIPENYALQTIKIVMGTNDITTSVYADGVIDISEVTANVSIVIEAYKIPTSNLRTIAYSFAPNSTVIYNDGLGYKNNCRIGGSIVYGNEKSWESSTPEDIGYVMTGCIAWDRQSPINIFGATLDTTDGKVRMRLTNNNRDYIYSPWIGYGNRSFEDIFTITSISSGSKTGYKLTPKSTLNASITHFCLSLKGSGEDLIITFGDDMGEDTQFFAVTNNLTYVTTNNSASSVVPNASYSATLTANDNYQLDSVTVVMSGVDVTNKYYDSNTNTITIDEVKGHIVITATATFIQTGTYINRIPLSTTNDGKTIFGTANTIGYETNYRLSTGDGYSKRENEGYCSTGYIPCVKGDVIRIKNITLLGGPAASGNVNLFAYPDYDVSYINCGVWTYTNLNNAMSNGEITLTNNFDSKYIRLCCNVINDDSIITINQKIT